ncbi:MULTISPECIES: universal stress protein [unclassified Kribbella]|uniref:universal stress protein n=1 Tax=unclassified Kribbella TaxID=2644121 RepID=UPI00301AE86B
MKEALAIAVGVDGSWADSGAVDWALYESRLSAAPIRVLHVVDSRPPVGPLNMPAAVQEAKQLVEEVREYLDRHDSLALHTGVILTGAPAQTLGRCTADDRMLVVGRHGRGLVGRLLIGSTAEAVVSESGTAVVVVPPKWSPGDQAAPVVVGLDEIEYCETAVAFAAGLAAERGAPIRLVHVWDVATVYTGDPASAAGAVDLARRYHNDKLEAVGRQCRERFPGVTFETELRRGHRVAELIDASEEAAAELLVVGGRSHHRLMAAMLGSTVRGILQHAGRPIAIVHQHVT